MNHFIQFLIELEIVGVDRVHRPVSEVFERVGGRVVLLGVGVNLEAVFERVLGCIGFAFLIQETAKDQPVDLAWGLGHEIALRARRCLLTGAKNQILAALAFVRSRTTHVHHKAEEGIIHRSRPCTGRHLHHHGPIAEIHECRGVHSVRVAREPERLGAHQIIKDADVLVRLHAVTITVTDVEHLDGCCRHEVQECLNTTAEIHLTTCQDLRLVVRKAIEIIEGTDARDNGVFGEHIFRNRCVVALGEKVVGFENNTASGHEQSGSENKLKASEAFHGRAKGGRDFRHDRAHLTCSMLLSFQL